MRSRSVRCSEDLLLAGSLLSPEQIEQLLTGAADPLSIELMESHLTDCPDCQQTFTVLTEIGDALRHRSPQTTTIYAKVDLKALRTLALPWPGGVR